MVDLVNYGQLRRTFDPGLLVSVLADYRVSLIATLKRLLWGRYQVDSQNLAIGGVWVAESGLGTAIIRRLSDVHLAVLSTKIDDEGARKVVLHFKN